MWIETPFFGNFDSRKCNHLFDRVVNIKTIILWRRFLDVITDPADDVAGSICVTDLIVLDEPTAALSLTETAKVFHFVRQVRASGQSILFIGRNIHDVFDIADRFVVLDRGKVALAADRYAVKSAEQLSTSWKMWRIPADCTG